MRGPLVILLVFIAIVVLLAVVIGSFFASRSRKQQEHRVEAAGIRSEAGELASTVTGQAAFAEQAEERAGVVRAEADEKARQAAALESDADAHRDQAEATRRDYEAQLRRADEIDPDVDDSSLPPVEEASPTRAERRAVGEDTEAGEGEVEADEAADEVLDPQPQESARVASAADFRDEVTQAHEVDELDEGEVYDGAERGTEENMNQTPQPADDEPTTHTPDDAAAAGAMAIVADPDEFASTEPLMSSEQSPPVERADLPASKERADVADLAAEESSGDVDDEHSDAEHVDPGGGGSEHAGAARDDSATDEEGNSIEDGSTATPTGAAEEGDQSSEEPYDPTPAKDWGADEGELLDKNHERGERLAQDRADLGAQEQTPTESQSATPGGAGSEGAGAEAAPSAEAGSGQQPEGRRISTFTELRDGGFGVGSAAPLEDRAQPLDHPVQAYRDTMTFRAPDDAGYDSTEPDVWFYDEGAAERSGFTRSQG